MSAPLCGVYTDPERMARLSAMERWFGRTHAVQTVFTPWSGGAIDDLFGRILPSIWNAGRIPLVTWEPFTPTPDATDADIAGRIAAGEFDGYIERWAGRLIEWLAGPDEGARDDRRLYLRLAHEMNGDWYPWSPAVTGPGDDAGGTPEEYVEMWRHVHDLVERAGVSRDRLQWVWCVNHEDVGPHSVEACYPGDEYVDWVGVDGFNWGHSRAWSSWSDPHEVFAGMFDRLDALTEKPRCVPEVGSSSLTATGHDPERKAAWIRDAYAYFENRVELCCWFNEDKETDCAVFGGGRGTEAVGEDGILAYSAYRKALTGVSEADQSSGRDVSDTAFRGG